MIISIYSFVVYVGWLAFPFLFFMGWLCLRKKWRPLAIVGIVMAVIFIYSRFIEPYWLVVNHEAMVSKEPLGIRVAIVSDIHLGLHKREDFLAKIVESINNQHPDLVLIAGDFTYYISPEELASMFAELRSVHAPVFAVTGNHDSRKPGELTSEEVRDGLRPYGVKMIDNEIVHIVVQGKEITIIGLSDLWEGKADYSLVDRIQENEFTIILTHNPDTAYELPNHKAALLVAGHTHGGQIRIPFFYQNMIPTEYPFDRGWYTVKDMPVFVTSGAGEVGLPMRFGIRPEVVIMEI